MSQWGRRHQDRVSDHPLPTRRGRARLLLSSVVLRIYRPGTIAADFTITLGNAFISEITDRSSVNGDLPLEDVFMTFQNITYTFAFGSTTKTYTVGWNIP